MKTFVFDFDGTLVDSMNQYGGVMTRILDENGINYPPDIMKIITPLGFVGTAKYYIEQFGMDKTEEELISLMNEYAYEQYAYHIEAKETVIDTLHTLKARGYRLNVLTASPHVTLDACLRRIGIYDLFDNVWSCNDFETTKADVNIYYKTAEKLGTTVQNCVFLDDNFNALRVSKKSGMEVIGVYDKTSEEYADEIKALCGKYIVKFDELLEIF